MVSLALTERSPWTAMSMRDRPAHSASCVSGLCGALGTAGGPPHGGRRRWFVGDDRTMVTESNAFCAGPPLALVPRTSRVMRCQIDLDNGAGTLLDGSQTADNFGRPKAIEESGKPHWKLFR